MFSATYGQGEFSVSSCQNVILPIRGRENLLRVVGQNIVSAHLWPRKYSDGTTQNDVSAHPSVSCRSEYFLCHGWAEKFLCESPVRIIALPQTGRENSLRVAGQSIISATNGQRNLSVNRRQNLISATDGQRKISVSLR